MFDILQLSSATLCSPNGVHTHGGLYARTVNYGDDWRIVERSHYEARTPRIMSSCSTQADPLFRAINSFYHTRNSSIMVASTYGVRYRIYNMQNQTRRRYASKFGSKDN